MPSDPISDSFSALITSEPPSRSALTKRFVYVSSSLFPHPLPPTSKDHLLESGAEPLGPLNSSLQARLHTVGSATVVAEELEYERLENVQRAISGAIVKTPVRSKFLVNESLRGLTLRIEETFLLLISIPTIRLESATIRQSKWAVIMSRFYS